MIDSRIVIGLIAVLISMGVLTYAGINEQDRMALAASSQEAKAIQNGAIIYEESCSECHGVDGKGVLGRAPALNTAHFFDGRLAEVRYNGSLESYVELTVAGGRPVKSDPQYAEAMPTWGQQYGGPLRPDQVRDVVSFVLNWEGEDRTADLDTAAMADSDDPFERGMAAFNNAGCSACHVAGGYANGNVGPDLTNTFAEKGGAEYIIESIMEPNAVLAAECPTGPCPANVMPANLGELLSPEEIDDIVEFLKGISEGR